MESYVFLLMFRTTYTILNIYVLVLLVGTLPTTHDKEYLKTLTKRHIETSKSVVSFDILTSTLHRFNIFSDHFYFSYE